MKLHRCLLLLLVVSVAACAGNAPEPAAETPAAEPAEAAPMDDGAMLDQLRDEFMLHYNLHHASMVADYYTDDAITLLADGSVNDGKDAILANLEGAMAASPTLTFGDSENVVMGDTAVAHGEYDLEMTPEGAEAISFSGNYMTVFSRVDDGWKIAAVISNYDAAPPEGMPAPPEPEGGPPPEVTDGPGAELTGYYATHFNMGHASMVASKYEEDAFASIANLPSASGRGAIEAQLEERFAAGSPQLTVHTVQSTEVAEGWVIDGGWYELTSESGNSTGAYVILARRGDDGELKIHWVVSNGNPVG